MDSNAEDELVYLVATEKGFSKQLGFEMLGQMRSRFASLFNEGRGLAFPCDDAGRVVSGLGGKTVTDRPFAEGKEEVGGYLMIQAASLDAASEIAKGCPVLLNGGSVEVRQIVHLPM